MKLVLFTIVVFVQLAAEKQKEAARKVIYRGWADDDLESCDESSGASYVDYRCLSYVWNYEFVNMELLNAEPPVIAYRRLVPKEYIKDFLADIENEKKKTQSKTTNSSGPSDAIEITIGHNAKAGAARVFKRLSNLIPFIDFKNSDPWQVLLFKRNAHFAPRYEYLMFDTEEKQDELTRRLGNRFATFTITLKEPQRGGKHVFPLLWCSFEMEVGDAMMWTNMNVDREMEHSMSHGDCPVKKGTKITATLRLRENGQYLLMSARPGGYYNYSMLVEPNLKYIGMTPAQ